MLHYVQHQTAMEMKSQYLESVGLIPKKPLHPALSYQLGSQVGKYVMQSLQ